MNAESEIDDCVAEFIVFDDGKRIGRVGWIATAVVVLIVAICVFAS